jgi:hypothetical protein
MNPRLLLQAVPPKRSCAPAPRGLLQRKIRNSELGTRNSSWVPSIVHEVLRSPGQPLDPSTRAFMEPRFGHDFSNVRVHSDSRAAESARNVSALAYTTGNDLVFGPGQYTPGTTTGRRLVAHELAHVVQQDGAELGSGTKEMGISESSAHETEADRAADSVTNLTSVSALAHVGRPAIQRKVEMRDVGRGEQSGFARLPELVTRLNAMSAGLTFSIKGQELAYEIKAGGTLSGFDNQMKTFIDQGVVIPFRLTNRHGLLGDKVSGFNDRVLEDAWSSGYVDIDDLLASSDLGLQSVLVHFLRERSATPNYARRIGSSSLDTSQPGPSHEFDRAHAQGIQAELQLLRDFFADPTIQIVPGAESGAIFRVYRNSRRDRIRTRVRSGHGAAAGVDAVSIEVVTRDGKTHTPEEYKLILAAGAANP